jgi:tRNA(His) guanylyltransferase
MRRARASAQARALGSTSAAATLELPSNGALPLNTWSHIAFERNGGTVTYWTNGTQTGSTTVSGNTTASTGLLAIGGHSFWGGEWFAGKIDDVRIYSAALTGAQIQTAMGSGTLMFDSLGDRMKSYEAALDLTLLPRSPVIVRVDGRAFHSWTRGMMRPFDPTLIGWMDSAAVALCEELQTAQLAYVQSDEISVLLHGYKRHESQPLFGNRLQKLCSVAASVAAAEMTAVSGRRAYFDARAFVLPEAEVTNYFLWRQNDASRNSLQMLARSLASHKECDGLGQAELQELCFSRGQNWNDLSVSLKRGRCAVRNTFEREGAIRHMWSIDNEIPIWRGDGRACSRRSITKGTPWRRFTGSRVRQTR